MKARITMEPAQTKEQENILFYKSLHKAMKKLYQVYPDFFDLGRVIMDIEKTKFYSLEERQKELFELSALQVNILSTLIGLNREKLESANSIAGNQLLQYQDHESTLKMYTADGNYETGIESAKSYCKWMNFNPSQTGPFPYMLEIISSDGKQRPYDCLSKIRNALLHGEYYLEDDRILHITNHDENNMLTFEGRLLIFPFTIFVKDFFGNQAVSSSFSYFLSPGGSNFKNEEDIKNFLREFSRNEIVFKKLPQGAKFKGQDSLYTRLNSCFDLTGNEQKDIIQELQTLKNEGYEYEEKVHKFTEEQIDEISKYVINKYKNIYTDPLMRYLTLNFAKLMINPTFEITNSLENLLDYISTKKFCLESNKLLTERLQELIYDQYSQESFNYALAILNSNKINYALECNKFKNLELGLIDTSQIKIPDQQEYERRKNNLDCKDDDESASVIILETIRNSLAHGGERIEVGVEDVLTINLTDKFHNLPDFEINMELDTLKELCSSPLFEPENIKIKKDKRIVKQKTNN